MTTASDPEIKSQPLAQGRGMLSAAGQGTGVVAEDSPCFVSSYCGRMMAALLLIIHA